MTVVVIRLRLRRGLQLALPLLTSIALCTGVMIRSHSSRPSSDTLGAAVSFGLLGGLALPILLWGLMAIIGPRIQSPMIQEALKQWEEQRTDESELAPGSRGTGS